MRRLLALVLVPLVLAVPLRADHITVSGDVSGTWSADTVLVTGEIRVPVNSTLTINPGTKVLFQTFCKFIVDAGATLLALGTPLDSIYFDEYNPGTGWHGIRFLAASPQTSLEYCSFRHGSAWGSVQTGDGLGGAIYCHDTNLTISNCLFTF